MKKIKQNGFTLFELLAVLSIIAIIAAIAVPKVIKTISHAKEKAIITSMENLTDSINRFCVEQELNNSYSSCKLDIDINGVEWHKSSVDLRDNLIENALKQYINEDVKNEIDIKIFVHDFNPLSKKDFGVVATYYPSVDASGKRFYDAGVNISSYDLPVYTENQWNNEIKNGVKSSTFILDTDGNGSDDISDFIVSIRYFQLNSEHKHNNLFSIKGTNSSNQNVNGTDGNDYIETLGGNDSINSSKGNDFIDGGSGNDTLQYDRRWFYYRVNKGSLTEIVGLDGTDTIKNIERLKFYNEYFSIDNLEESLKNIIKGTKKSDNYEGSKDNNGNDLVDYFLASDGIDHYNNSKNDKIIINGYRKDYEIKYNFDKRWLIIDKNNPANKIYLKTGTSTAIYFYDTSVGLG